MSHCEDSCHVCWFTRALGLWPPGRDEVLRGREGRCNGNSPPAASLPSTVACEVLISHGLRGAPDLPILKRTQCSPAWLLQDSLLGFSLFLCTVAPPSFCHHWRPRKPGTADPQRGPSLDMPSSGEAPWWRVLHGVDCVALFGSWSNLCLTPRLDWILKRGTSGTRWGEPPSWG